MTLLTGRSVPFPGWVAGLVQDAEPNVRPLGGIVSGLNLVPLPAGLQQTRGGSRIMLTLHDGGAAELTSTQLLLPFTPVGAVAVGWSDPLNKHYAYRLTSDMAFFTGTEATSRVDLTAAPSTGWANTTTPARPVAAELFEKLFLVDATLSQPSRNMLLSLDSAGTVLMPTFTFAAGPAAALTPYCCEEYNGVLFIAGYGDEGDKDRPEMLRHSFLARSPDASDGFDKDAYNLIGAKGQRITALRKGRGLLLVAKDREFYRITGFGRAYPGWQYQVEMVENTLGLGVSNPLALTFAEGYWYGIGQQGPLRTDGFAVESLTGPRQRDWRGIDHIENASVAYHPERGVVLFNVHPVESPAGRDTAYPWRQWVWDIERAVWQTDWELPVSIAVTSYTAVAAVTTTTAQGPSAVPTAPNTTAVTVSGYTANWTNGDATAETEIWEKTGAGGTWMLVTTVAAGVAFYVRTGRTSHIQYYWKVRHRKSGVTSSYTTELGVQTLIKAPTLTRDTSFDPFLPSGFTYIIINADPGTTTTIERSAIGAGVWSFYTSGADLANATLPRGFDYRGRSADGAWTPTQGANSATLTIPA